MSSGEAKSEVVVGVDVAESTSGNVEIAAKGESRMIDIGSSSNGRGSGGRNLKTVLEKNVLDHGRGGGGDKNDAHGRTMATPPPPQSHPPAPFQPHLQVFPYYTYPQQGTITPTPPSPTVTGVGGYGMMILQQQQAAMASPFGAQYDSSIPPPPPLSPAQSNANVTSGGATNGIPASPIFAATPSSFQGGHPLSHLDSPSIARMAETSMTSPLSPLPYNLAPQVPIPNSPCYGGIYQVGYGGIVAAGYRNPASGENPASLVSAEQVSKGWLDSVSSTQQQRDQLSPHTQTHVPLQQYQIGLVASDSNHSSQSFDEMLPPSVFGGRDHSLGTYPLHAPGQPIGAGPVGGGGTLFSHQQPWGGYGSPGRGIYERSHRQQNTREHAPGSGGASYFPPGRHIGAPPGSVMGGHGAGQSYYAATTPGPPIQTTPSNKGPDGANLFIFHIPNHFTNLDMYNLFCHYGNLLSVRIMVEKDTGRSRGFGFVSYDSPEAAAMAIKELNGFVIGNKRLKVQHKQIRASDNLSQQQQHSTFHQQPTYNMPLKGDHGLHQREFDTSDLATPVESDGTSTLSNWYGGPGTSASETREDSSKRPPSASAPFSLPEEAPTTAVVQPPFQSVEDNLTGDHSQKDVSLGLLSPTVLIEEVSQGPPSENHNVLPPFTVGGLDSSDGSSGAKVLCGAPGNKPSPLGNFDSIRNALPDASK